MSNIETLFNSGLVWQDANGYHSACKFCGTLRTETLRTNVWRLGSKKDKHCSNCRVVPDYSGNNNPFFGKKHSNSSKCKQSYAKRGKLPPNKGIPCTPDQKRKNRIAAVERLIRDGISFNVDKGANECFDFFNAIGTFNVEHPNIYLKELGYLLDGYDVSNHSVYEYDTSYHLQPYQQKKDLMRQENIISHFKTIGRPLNAFYRITMDASGGYSVKNVIGQP